jgi:hypothetical protein
MTPPYAQIAWELIDSLESLLSPLVALAFWHHMHWMTSDVVCETRLKEHLCDSFLHE